MRDGLLWRVPTGTLLEIAKALHGGQTYRVAGGPPKPYGYHLEQVYLRLATDDVDLPVLIAGAFHDALEDGCIHEAGLRCLIGEEATGIVLSVTRHTRTHPGEDPESYSDYIARVARSGPGAIAVKLADLDANLSNDPTPSQRKRYEEARQVLLGVRG